MSSISGSATAYNAYDIDQEFTTSERGSSTASNGNLKSNEVNYRKVIPNSPLNKALPNASEAGRIIKTVGGGVASNKLSTSFQDVGTELKRPFFHIISPSSGGLLGAIGRLDDELKNAGREGLISNKRPSTWTGRMVSPGEGTTFSSFLRHHTETDFFFLVHSRFIRLWRASKITSKTWSISWISFS